MSRESFERSSQIVHLPDVVEQMDRAGQWMGSVLAARARTETQDYFTRMAPCESPLEAIFYAWFMSVQAAYLVSFEFSQCPWLTLYPQHEVEASGRKYRLDFAVAVSGHIDGDGDDYARIAIELDGHDFHERTREQVAYRNQRDRSLQSAGWRVFHVSGSELYRDPASVVQEIVTHCFEEFSALRKRQRERAPGALETAATV